MLENRYFETDAQARYHVASRRHKNEDDPNMKRLLTGCIAMLLASAAAAQILECVDAKGKKEFAQTCPPGTVKETQLMKGGAAASSPGAAASAPATKTLAERDAEFRKRNLERQESETKTAKDQADAKDAQRNCEDSRSQLKALQEGHRIARTDPKTGEVAFLEDAKRPAEIANAQKAVDGWCNKK